MFSERSSRNAVVLDRISSSLPDEVLVSILSKLSIQEAARSSILSHRWLNLWIHYEGNLEFDFRKKLRNVPRSDWPQIKLDYVKSMNQMLMRLLLGSSPSFNSLILRFQCLKTDTLIEFDFDAIVGFLMAKRFRILEINMHVIPALVHNFALPVGFYAWIKQPRAISPFTSLSFNNVSLRDDTVEYFVSNCPFLERLCVRKSDLLSNLRIISHKLKYLKILGLEGMKSLVVSAPNLVHLEYHGVHHEIKLVVFNVPKLLDLSIGKDIITYMSGTLSTYLHQIHTLRLSFTTFDMKDMNFTPPNNVVFSNLKHLILTVVIRKGDESLLGFTSSMVEASPRLEKFTLEALNCVDEEDVGLHKMTTSSKKHYYQNQRLKVVELTEFTGFTSEVELLVYFVENFSISLERIIIDTRVSINDMEKPGEVLQARKELGRQLMKLVPPGVNFVLK